MPCWLAVVPRRILPPPTTKPSWTPRACTAFNSSVSRSMTPTSMPEPPARWAAQASPETFSRARPYASFPANSAPSELEPGEAAHLDLLAGLAGERLHQIADLDLVVLHERLLEQHVLLVELAQLPLDDLGLDALGFLLLGHLGGVDAPFPLDDLGGNVLHPHGDRPGRRDVQGQVLGELAKLRGIGDEVGLAVDLDHRGHAAIEVQVHLDQPLGGGAVGALLGLRGVFDADHLLRLGHVALGFLERPLAVHHARARAGAELGHLFRVDRFRHRAHFAPHKNAALAPFGRRAAVRGSQTRSGYASPPPTGSTGAEASSVFRRAAIASGLGRRLRRAGRFFRSPSASASTPVSVEYVVPSPSSAASRSGIWCRASLITPAIATVIRETARMASSLPGIGTLIRSGSAFVSTIATTGIPSLLASATAMRSFFASTTNSAPGSRPMFLMPARFFSSFTRSRSNSSCSFFV